MKQNEPTKKQALKIARILGCEGAHKNGNGWMPCLSNEEYVAIKKGKEEYLKVRATIKLPPQIKIVNRTQRLETKSDAYYESRSDAVNISKLRGCGGVRTVVLDGKKYYTVCNHRAPKKGWENLAEKPITGIATLPGGGLVTGSFSGKSLGRPIGGVAEFDGDGDGFSTGPDGEDNIPAPKIPKKLFHGSTVKLNVGDYLLPPSETGVKPRAHPNIDAVEFNNTNYVYFTSKLEDAHGYGSDAAKPGQKIYIYEVEPSADVEEDPENEMFGVEGGFRSRKAKIKKIVATLPGDGFSTGPDGQDTVPAPPTVTANNKNKFSKDISKELGIFLGKDVPEYLKSEGYKEIQKREEENQTGYSPDVRLEIIADKQGFSGLPKVVSSKEMAQLEKEGWTIAYRGIANTKTQKTTLSAKDLAKQFKTGKYFGGYGTYGNGTYFATDIETAEDYAGEDGEIIKVAIPPNALMERKEFKNEVIKHQDSFNGNKPRAFYGDDDIGRVLAAKGVRGVRMNLIISGSFVAEVGEAIETNVILVWDRSMLVVEESSK